MTTVEFLSHLYSLNVRLWIDGDRLRYSAPDGVVTPVLHAELSERKVEIVAFLRDAGGAVRSVCPPIRPVSRREGLPLSFAQQRLWFLHRLEPASAVYNIPIALRLVGRLNVRVLGQSLNEVVRRHKVLRTVFTIVEGQPLQTITSGLEVMLPIIDLGQFSKAGWNAEGRRLAMEEAQRPFDLTQGPLVRATLLRLSEEEHILLLTIHHIAADGWSIGLLIKEVAAHYQAFVVGKPSPLPELPIQYTDFALWQREWLRGEVLEEQLAYWKQQLDGAPAVLELPTDRPRPRIKTYLGARRPLNLSEPLSRALEALSQQEGVTLFMTLLAAFKTLLYRYTGQEDIVVGSPIANRNRSEIEGLIGFFVNTLVLRTDLSGNPTFRELLKRVHRVTLDAYVHQDLPFEILVKELQPERRMSHTPLFQVMFVLQNAPMEALELPGLTLRPLDASGGTSKFDLLLNLIGTEQGLTGGIEYSTDLFDAPTIGRMIGHLQTLLEGVVTDPEQRLSDLPLLTEAERRQLQFEWNDTKADYPHESCIHELFERQVEHRPDTMAVVFEDQCLTYQGLNRRANQLAHYLQSMGVGAEILVGVCVERSLDMMVGLLGVLKAGGAYVPLDPTYPQERLAFVIKDTQLRVLLTQDRLLAKLPHHEAQTVCLDADWPVIASESAEKPISEVAAGNLAYVIYTSGSTGLPKGAAIVHQGMVALLHWAREILDTQDIAGALASTSICFDSSVFELFVPSSWGGKIILAENALQLPALLAAEQVAWVNTVPSAISELLRDGLPASVRTVSLAGEPLRTPLVRHIYEQSTVRRVFDFYGLSEDTIYSTFALRNAGGPDTIGRPIANRQVYLLDANLRSLPVGVPGELYVGGVGLGRGYLNRPGLTAERFIPDPFSDEPGARLYRTGDLARYLPDGNIEFLGRLDYQVKIRGFRIELREIEAVLGQHPELQEAVVLAWDAESDFGSGRRLIAYVVANQGQEPATSELRRFLQEKLPEYMVPSAFVILEALPLTPNGKVDRRALPAPGRIRAKSERIYVPPRTPTESALAGTWAKILGVERVGVHDNFFELGGHSLLATQVISCVRDHFQVELPLRSFFETPTVAGLAQAIENIKSCGAEQQAPAIAPLSRERYLLKTSPSGALALPEAMLYTDEAERERTRRKSG